MHDDAFFPAAALGRPLTPPPGGLSRLVRALAPDAASRRHPTGRLALASTMALVILALGPGLGLLQGARARHAIEGRLQAAVAEAGQPGPDVRIGGMVAEAVTPKGSGPRVYLLNRADDAQVRAR
jgi:hypothetical protein